MIDPTQSDITGTGVQNLQAFDTVTVTVTAKDSSGNLIGTGGSILTIEVHNECTLDIDLVCTEVIGATQVLASPIVANMTDNSDGTYDYSYSVNLNGKVTVFVYEVTGVVGYYYGTVDWTGSYNK